MIRKGSRILIVRDGKDKQDSPARRSEQKGVDYLLQAGMKVSITDTPADTDVNILLKNPADPKPNLQAGRRKVRQLLNKSVAAALSFEGRVSQLTELPKTAYEQARLRVAKEYGVRVKHVDREVATEYRRLHPPPVTEREEEEDLGKPVEDPPWTDPVNLAVALDEHVQETRRYLVAPKHYCDLSSLWTAGTHCVHSEVIWLSVMAQIGATSLGPSAGKSVWLQCIAASACRGMVRSSYTASTLFRRIHQYQVTPCLSELHDILHPANRELLAIIKACHRRDEAYVDRTENLADGSRVARTYFCWAALAWAAIGLPPREVIERSIILPLKPALPSERDKLRRGSPKKSRVFARVRRHFAAWAQGVKSLPDPPMPAWLYNREGQNWWVLFSIAELAGGDWPERIRIAAEKLHALDRPEAFEVRLLAGVQNAFTDSESSRGPAQQLERLTTHELLERLRQQEDLGLREANNYRDLTEYWLRENLRGLITDPNHSQEWREGNGKDPPKHVRGYYRSQFTDAFGRYLENGGAHPGAEPSGASGTSGISPEKRQATAIFSIPDGVPDAASSSAHLESDGENDRQPPFFASVSDQSATASDPGPHPGLELSQADTDFEAAVPDVPDVPDTLRARLHARLAAKPAQSRGEPGENANKANPTRPSEPAENGSESSKKGSGLSFLPVDPIIRQFILQCRADHPEWSVETLRRRLRIKKSVVLRVLGEEQRS